MDLIAGGWNHQKLTPSPGTCSWPSAGILVDAVGQKSYMPHLHVVTWLPFSMVAGSQEPTAPGSRKKCIALLWPNLSWYIASFPLYANAWGSYEGPSRIKGRRHRPHLSMGRVSTSHCRRVYRWDMLWWSFLENAIFLTTKKLSSRSPGAAWECHCSLDLGRKLEASRCPSLREQRGEIPQYTKQSVSLKLGIRCTHNNVSGSLKIYM